jgi:hypothetical protein
MTLILILYILLACFPLRWAKGSPFMQSSMKVTYIFFPHNLFKILIFVATCEFSIIYYKIILWFFARFKSTNYEKIILKFIVISIAHARLCIILPSVREITHIKTYNVRIKSSMCKRAIEMKISDLLG